MWKPFSAIWRFYKSTDEWPFFKRRLFWAVTCTTIFLIIPHTLIYLFTGFVDDDEFEVESLENKYGAFITLAHKKGVIGDVSIWETSYSNTKHVYFVALRHLETGTVLKYGVGFRVRNEREKRDFVLTASHVLDPGDADLKMDDYIIFVGDDVHLETSRHYKINVAPDEFYHSIQLRLNANRNDTSFFEVPFDQSIPAIELDRVGIPETQTKDSVKPNVSVKSILSRSSHQPLVRVAQNSKLLFKPNLGEYRILTNADAVPGVSGSPVEANQQVVGILVRGPKTDTCAEVKPFVCSSVIELIYKVDLEKKLASEMMPVEEVR